MSNLSEARAGTDPLVDDTATEFSSQEQEEFDLIETFPELTKTLAGFQLDRMAYVTEDLLYILAQQTTIQWPDNDYYQAQYEHMERSWSQTVTYPRLVCEGGNECRVLPGTHTVINHTTNERSELVVPYVDTENLPHATRLPDRLIAVDGAEGTDSLIVERTQYHCEHGGTVITERSVDESTEQQMLLINPDEHDLVSIRERTTTSYLFDQCRMTIHDSTLPSGMLVANGNLHSSLTFHNFADYTGYITFSRHQQFDGFSIIASDGLEYQVDGETERYSYSREDGQIYNGIRSTAIAQYVKTSPDGQIVESIADGHYEYSTSNISGYRTSQEIAGSVRTAQTRGQVVTFTSDPKLTTYLTYNRDDGFQIGSPFSGTIELLAEDGALLFIQANPFFDESNARAKLVDYDYTAANGDQVQIEKETYGPTATSSAICAGGPRYARATPTRSSATKRLYCESGGEFVAL